MTSVQIVKIMKVARLVIIKMDRLIVNNVMMEIPMQKIIVFVVIVNKVDQINAIIKKKDKS